MSNVDDPKRPTHANLVWEAVFSERDYQLLRWGVRQKDGSFAAAKHNDADWICYIGDYITEAMREASRKAGADAALDVLRKVAAMCVCRFEDLGVQRQDVQKMIYSVPVEDIENVTQTLIRIKLLVREAEMHVARQDSARSGESFIAHMLAESIKCFQIFGIAPRDLTKVVNGRDNKPATTLKKKQ